MRHFERSDLMIGWGKDCYGEPKPYDYTTVWSPHPIQVYHKEEGGYKLHWLVPRGDEIIVAHEWFGSATHGCDTVVFYDFATKVGVAVKDASEITDYETARKLINEKGGKRDCCGRFPLI